MTTSPARLGHYSGLNLNRPLLGELDGLAQLGSASQYEDEIFEMTEHVWLFEDLARTEVSQLCGKMQCFAARRGDQIIREGGEGDFMVIVLTGEVSVIKQDYDGARKQIATVGPGCSLGEMSLVDGRPRFASCIAREPTDFAVLTRDSIYDILVLNPSLGNKVLLIILQNVSQRLRDTCDKLLPFLGAAD